MKFASVAALTVVATAAAAIAVESTVVSAAAAPPARARLNGRDLDPARPAALRAGDRLETADAPVEIPTAAGRVTVAPRSVLVHQGAERGVEYLFVASGAAEGDVGASASLGGPASWAAAPEAGACRVRVSVPDTDRDTTSFRALRGGAWLRFHAVSTWLPERCDVTLAAAADGPGSLRFASAASNPASVEVQRGTPARAHVALAAPGVAGSLSDRSGATRLVCREAPSGSLLRLEVRRDGRTVARGGVAPGAEAVLDGDRVRVDVPAAGRGRLAALLALESEFAALGGP